MYRAPEFLTSDIFLIIFYSSDYHPAKSYKDQDKTESKKIFVGNSKTMLGLHSPLFLEIIFAHSLPVFFFYSFYGFLDWAHVFFLYFYGLFNGLNLGWSQTPFEDLDIPQKPEFSACLEEK